MADPWKVNLLRLMATQEEDDEDKRIWEFMSQIQSNTIEFFTRKHGGSLPGKGANLPRNREAGFIRIMEDYFGESPVYSDRLFRRRFRMNKSLFLRIVVGLSENEVYFTQRRDAAGVLGLHPIQKIMPALRQLCYGVAADSVDEYIRIGESTALQCLKKFCESVVKVFGTEYLREPTVDDMRRQLAINEQRGFPGMFASVDCTHWIWKNCPIGWQGQFQDKKGFRSIILEAACSKDLWIWHYFFGIPGSNNDINVIDRSPLLTNYLKGSAPTVEYKVNDKNFQMSYFLADGIYPNYPIFMKTINEPQGEKYRHYAAVQEGVRKDIERCFGVLKARFALLNNPCRLWSQDTMRIVMKACICIHNMICEDERDKPELNNEFLFENFQGIVPASSSLPFSFDRLRSGIQKLRDESAYFNLRTELVDHLWKLKGEN